MKKTLIIVDAQRDFATTNGSLYVPNSDIAIGNIVNFIKLNKEQIDCVVFTVDNHPSTHCSFKENGGTWPMHCVRDTSGAEIVPELINVCKDYKLKVKKVKKGEKELSEEYTAFSRSRRIGNVTILRSETSAVIVNADKFVVCGFAGDFCVRDSLKDLIETVGAENIEVFSDGIASIDGGTSISEFILANGLSVVDTDGKKVKTHYTLSELDLPNEIYMIARVKAFKGNVVTLRLHDSVIKGGDGNYTVKCYSPDSDYQTAFDAKKLLDKKHESKNGFAIGRYRYFSNEDDAKNYMIEHSWD